MHHRLAGLLVATMALLAAAAPSLAADDPATRVVFADGCDIWIAPLTGEAPQNLTGSPACETNPTVSRTGRFVAWGTGVAGISVLDRTTGGVTSVPGGQSPDFSPVTDDIAFTVSSSGVTDIYVSGPDGSGRRKLTTDAQTLTSGNRFPRWSDDGEEIIFSRGEGAPFCRVDRGGYDDLCVSYRLAGVTLTGVVTEILAEPLTAFSSGQRSGGVFAYVRNALEPASGGYCVTEPTADRELVVDGVVRDSATSLSRVAVGPRGDVVYAADGDVRYIPAGGGDVRTLFPGSQPDLTIGDTRDPRARARVTADVDGPGVVEIRPGDAECASECAEVVTAGDEVTVRAVADEPKGGFVGFRDCPGPVTYGPVGTCRFTAEGDVTVTAVFDPIPSYAPWVQFHPRERHWPMDPSEFVRRSSLDFANPNGAHGRGCPTKDARIVGRGKIISSWLPDGRYRYRYCSGLVRRGAQAPGRRVTLTTRQLTAPAETKNKAKVTADNGRWGFYLNLDNDAWKGRTPPDESGGTYPNAPVMYVQYVPRRYITYWFFSARNYVKLAGVKDVHEGDWERIAVRLDTRNQAVAAGYWQHLCDADVHSWAKMRRDGAIAGRSHPRVYVAKGAHASYHVPRRSTRISCPPWVTKGVGDSHPGGGVTWETWQKGAGGFREATKAPWYGFGGSWGSETSEGTKRFPGPFWGPLGPGPKKRPAPAGW